MQAAVVAVLLGGLAITVASCSSGAPIGGTPVAQADQVPSTLPPNSSLVAYGAQFLTTCRFSHTLPDDPIVHHDRPGASHEHELFGNITTDASSTFASLHDQPSTCSDIGDRSAYWVPTLFIDGKRVVPRRVDAYYRVAAGVAPAAVKPFPNGLQALAGNQEATAPQSLQVVAWACGNSPDLSHQPPRDCTSDRPVTERLTFPSCWDGEHAASKDFVSHLSYPSVDHGCDPDHPVPIPQLTLVVHYPLTGSYGRGWLASGTFDTAHGDFFDAWNPRRLKSQVSGCLNRGVTCGIVGGTFHTGRGSGDTDSYDVAPETAGTTTLPVYDGGVTTTTLETNARMAKGLPAGPGSGH